MDIVCYSERILNPFRGVMNVIALDDAEAVTTDGVNWSLYVRDRFDTADEIPEEFDNIDNPHIRFGTWSEAEGLKRAPVLPSYPGPGSTLGPAMTFAYQAAKHLTGWTESAP